MRGRDQRGLSESVQWTILTPLIGLVVIGSVQVGVWLHGSTVARQAAGAAADAASISGGSEAAARAVASTMTKDLRDVHVTVTGSATTVTVTVTGRTQTFVDLGQGTVSATVTQPKEPR